VTIPLGVTTIALATTDLSQMRAGQMDPTGRTQTENGRTTAIIGLGLGAIFSAGWGLLHWTRF
jgi:hypothetical protein